MKIKVKSIFFIFPILFSIEMILGYTGTLVMFGRVSIRVVLFILTFISLYGYLLYYMKKNKIRLFSKKQSSSIFGSFSYLDWIFLLVFVLSLISMIIIPIKIGNFELALDEARDSIAMMSLFFPISYLIKQKEISLNKYDKLLSVLIFILALTHIILYLGQLRYSTFIFDYFRRLIAILGFHGIAPPIILGNGYVRIIYSTSILLMYGIYIYLKNFSRIKLYEYIFLLFDIVALLTTMTKSLWLGAVAGFGLFFLVSLYFNIRKKQYKDLKKTISVFIGILFLVVVLDFTLFSGIIGIRISNTFTTSSSQISDNNQNSISKFINESEKAQKKKVVLTDMDKQGAQISNDIKIEQTRKLLKEWGKSPLIGNGYGSYIKDYIRSVSSPFSYEMTIPALLMKIGLVGLGAWGCLLVSILLIFASKMKVNWIKATSGLSLIICFFLCIQTNPLLLNFTGIGFLLLVTWNCVDIKTNEN